MRLRLCLLAAALLIALPMAAPQARDTVAEAIFTAIERQILLDYYRDHRVAWVDEDDWDGGKKHKKQKGLPPGLAKKHGLPPGLAKQLQRNGTLPPGLSGRALPDDLLLRLPLRPQYQRIIVVDEQVLLIDRATNLILDLLVLGTR